MIGNSAACNTRSVKVKLFFFYLQHFKLAEIFAKCIVGSTENARPDKNGPRITRGLTLQDLTLTDQIAGVEKARPGSDGANHLTLKFWVFTIIDTYCI